MLSRSVVKIRRSGIAVWGAACAGVVRWKNRQTQFSIISAALPLLLIVVFATDLVFRHHDLRLNFAAAWLVFYGLLVLIPLVLGDRYPKWAGIVVVLATESWSAFLVVGAGHAHAEMNVLLQLPTIALYLGWFYSLGPALACMVVTLARMVFGFVWAPGLGVGNASPTIVVGYAALISVFIFFGARAVRAQSDAQMSLDVLTGVFNRRGTEVAGQELLRRAERAGGTHTIVVVDFDDFKSVNDRGGHAAGDALLRREAKRLRVLLGAGSGGRGRDGIIGRLGGDEFVVIRRGPFAAMRRDLLQLQAAGAGAWSWGAVQVHQGEALAAALARADAELYLAKGESRPNEAR